MVILRKESLTNLKERWNALVYQNNTMQPYQEWKMTSIIHKYYLPFIISEKEVPIYFSFNEDNDIIAIAPMVRRYGDKYPYANFGKAPTIAIKDFIYPSRMSLEKMIECLEVMRAELGAIRFYDVPEYSLLYQALEKMGKRCKDHIYTMISFGGGYDVYYQALTKHMRQNIRTAYNYLEKNGIECSFEIIRGKELLRDDEDKLMEIYLSRRGEHKKVDSALHKYYLKHFHYYTLAHRKLESSYFGILRLNGDIAAFWSGFCNPTKDYISCPRLALDAKYSRCSPGIILLCETAKMMEKTTGINQLDLSRGNHDYKMRMGGLNYYSHDYILESK